VLQVLKIADMPSYEVTLILKTLAKPELAATLKRTALHILDRNGIIFGIEKLGTRQLPFVMSAHSVKHNEGSYFLIKYDGPVSTVNDLQDEFYRDIDIIRAGVAKAKPPKPFDCTLEEELKPPAYRQDVAELIRKGKKKEQRFDPLIGLPYDPWK